MQGGGWIRWAAAALVQMQVRVQGELERLPFGCHLLRGAIDGEGQRAVAKTTGALANDAFPAWTDVAAAQDHPVICVSHATGVTQRARECVRACGLQRCSGACGRHVGVLTEPPADLLALAVRAVERVRELWRDDDDNAPPPLVPTHFWALVYGSAGRANKMAPHLDRPVGWTLSICIGGDASVTLGCPPPPGSCYESFNASRALPGQHAPGTTVALRAGDALLFQGHAVFHSVDSASAASAALGVDLGVPRDSKWTPARLALLFRDQRDE